MSTRTKAVLVFAAAVFGFVMFTPASYAADYEYTFTAIEGDYQTSNVNCAANVPAGWTFHDRECLLSGSTPFVGACHSDVCLWRKPATQKLEYYLTNMSSAGQATCSNNVPGGGWTLKNKWCAYHNGQQGAPYYCTTDICLWERTTTVTNTNVLTGHAGTGVDSRNVNCAAFEPSDATVSASTENTQINISQSIYQRACVIGNSTGYGCVSDLCLWQERAAASVTPECTTNTDCGTDGYEGANFCQGNGVHRNYQTWTCNNPNTASASCSSNVTAQQQSSCSSSQVCSAGACIAGSIACSNNTVCGSTGYGSNPLFCQGNSIYRNSTTATCVNPGTTASYCTLASTNAIFQSNCANNQTCTGAGVCINNAIGSIACSSDSQCGATGYTGPLTCQGNGVYRNYTTNSCVNPGTVNSYCAPSSTANQFQYSCNSGQICTGAGVCTAITIPPTCTNHSYFQCSGNGVYWYDSCGNRQELYQACTGSQTCSNNSCVTTAPICTPNSTYRCFGNALYWFDSCGNQGGLYQACGSGQVCSNNACVTQTQTLANLLITTKVRNLSSGNLTYAPTTTATPGDVLQIQITLQNTGTQPINNIMVKDVLPVNIHYYDNLTIDGVANSGNITSGVNLGSLGVGQTKIITYQVQVAPGQNFPYGSTTLSNYITITSDAGQIATSSISIYVTKSILSGAVVIPTGWTDNVLFDSFILPLLLTLAALRAWRAGFFREKLPAWVRKGSN